MRKGATLVLGLLPTLVTGCTAAPSPPPPAASCGDAVCSADETCAACAVDCGACILLVCGDAVCDPRESCSTCATDCGPCVAPPTPYLEWNKLDYGDGSLSSAVLGLQDTPVWATAADPDLIWDTRLSRWVMCHSSLDGRLGRLGINLVTSDDLINWRDVDGNWQWTTLPGSAAGAPDPQRETCELQQLADDLYRLYWVGYSKTVGAGDADTALFAASSTNLLDWVPENGGRPLMTRDTDPRCDATLGVDQAGFFTPGIVRVAPDDFRMTYVAYACDVDTYRVCLATATSSDGLVWEKQGCLDDFLIEPDLVLGPDASWYVVGAAAKGPGQCPGDGGGFEEQSFLALDVADAWRGPSARTFAFAAACYDAADPDRDEAGEFWISEQGHLNAPTAAFAPTGIGAVLYHGWNDGWDYVDGTWTLDGGVRINVARTLPFEVFASSRRFGVLDAYERLSTHVDRAIDWTVDGPSGGERILKLVADARQGTRPGSLAVIPERSYVDFTMTLRARAADAGSRGFVLVFGYTEADAPYYQVRVEEGAAASLLVVSTTEETLVAEGSAATWNTSWSSFTLMRDGDVLTLEQDGILLLQTREATAQQVGGLGLGGLDEGWNADFDDVKVESPLEISTDPRGGRARELGNYLLIAPPGPPVFTPRQREDTALLIMDGAALTPTNGLPPAKAIYDAQTADGDFAFSFLVGMEPETVDPDLVVVFGYQDEDRYFFARLSSDPAASAVHEVVGGTATEVQACGVQAIEEGEAWNQIEVARSSGRIEISRNGTPICSLPDATTMSGKVGIGSWDDGAYFTRLRLTLP